MNQPRTVPIAAPALGTAVREAAAFEATACELPLVRGASTGGVRRSRSAAVRRVSGRAHPTARSGCTARGPRPPAHGCAPPPSAVELPVHRPRFRLRRREVAV